MKLPNYVKTKKFILLLITVLYIWSLFILILVSTSDYSYIILAYICLFILISLVIILVKYIKNYKQRLPGIIIFLLVLALNIYFYYPAYRVEHILADGWYMNPGINAAYSTLRNVNALVKIVMVDLLAIIAWIFLKPNKMK